MADEIPPPYRGEVVIPSPTHAGGVVLRRDGPELRFLLVTARRQPGLWVFPKGHIETGETPEQAAAREVFEEAGVVATIVAPVGATEFKSARGPVRAQFYLMEFSSESAPGEDRRRAWMTANEARRALIYEDARLLITRAATKQGPSL